MIRRGLPLLDLPVRTVIRADWMIDNYQLGVHQPPGRFVGAFIDGPRAPEPGGTWDRPITTALVPTCPPPTPTLPKWSVTRPRALDGRLLDGLPRFRFLAGGISDFLAINRVAGVTPALGARVALGSLLVLRAHGGIGLSDHRVVG